MEKLVKRRDMRKKRGEMREGKREREKNKTTEKGRVEKEEIRDG